MDGGFIIDAPPAPRMRSTIKSRRERRRLINNAAWVVNRVIYYGAMCAFAAAFPVVAYWLGMASQ